MKRGTTPACKYCSTVEVFLSVRRTIRRFGLLIPDFAVHELDGVARRIAHVNGLATQRPADLALYLLPGFAQLRRDRFQLPVPNPEGQVSFTVRAVRWHEPARFGAHLRIEDQKQSAVVEPKRGRVLARRLDLADAHDVAVEGNRRRNVAGVDDRFVDAPDALRHAADDCSRYPPANSRSTMS